MNIVFTGPAINCNGHTVARASLLQAVKARGGMMVQNSVSRTTDLLVASRIDTVKATAAFAMNTRVLSYPEFFRQYLPQEPEEGGELDRWVDHKPVAKPEKITQVQLSLFDVL